MKIKENNIKLIDKDTLDKYSLIAKMANTELMNNYQTSLSGLSKISSTRLLNQYGKNNAIKDDNKSWLFFFINAFKDQFIIILLFLGIINLALGDKLGSFVIFIIAFISASIRFSQDFMVYHFNKKLKSKIYATCEVVRNDKIEVIRVENIVPGDIVKLNAGSLIPADIKLIDCKDLFINQSNFTGEAIPVEKNTIFKDATEIFDINNVCLMGSNVVSGIGTGIVFNTGLNTYLGKIGNEVEQKHESTNFDKGMERITKLLIRYMIVVCFFVLIVDGVIKNNFSEAILFALSVAVGITPSMLPMIVNVNLTKGSRSLASKKTLVKRIESIQNLGAIDILCTDKTGTLTENNIVLQKYINVLGNEDETLLEYAYLNSYYGTGTKNLIDRAIVSYGKEHSIDSKIKKYEKVDEIPFDYIRRKMTIVVRNNNDFRMLTKGALEEIIKICSKVKINQKNEKINQTIIDNITKKAKELAESGMQVIALCEKNEYPGSNNFNDKCEKDMIFVGLVGFLDPPKKGVKKVLSKLSDSGVKIKILTGDNQYATQAVCKLAGLNDEQVLLGMDIDKMSDLELSRCLDDIDIYARLNPLQKERIVSLYKENNHVVGYMGDGVNDSPSLHKADIGISVNTASDIAKESSDIILLEQNLEVVYDGVIEGRRVYGNIIKYMKMALSADFGDVFSIMIASIFLPFLPLLPIQMLFQDFIYDISQIGIPYDQVDTEFLNKPKKWDTKGISRFMKVMGITSSLIDVISFLIFWFIFKYNSVDKQAYFQTAWFITCLITELMIIINVRTSKKPFIESSPSRELSILTIFSMFLTIIIPILLFRIKSFHFVILPISCYLYVILLVLLYFIIVSIIKKIYIKKYQEWL